MWERKTCSAIKRLTIASRSLSFVDRSCGGWRTIGFSLNQDICRNGTVCGDTLEFQRDGIQQEVSFEQHENTLVVTHNDQHADMGCDLRRLRERFCQSAHGNVFTVRRPVRAYARRTAPRFPYEP